jgi:hypothetical protein
MRAHVRAQLTDVEFAKLRDALVPEATLHTTGRLDQVGSIEPLERVYAALRAAAALSAGVAEPFTIVELGALS